MLNLLHPDADIDTNGYSYGSGHSYTNSNVDSDGNCHGDSDWDRRAEVYTDAEGAPHARPAAISCSV